eukprot:INCI13206.1.p1 GENE.INCI13206.1~~INCI13206.1.p1  ORF type:complete len:415 (+),score=93.64 INCI13206.1:120-1364(+)
MRTATALLASGAGALLVGTGAADYTLTVDSTTVSIGEQATVSWDGACSHDDLTCWDWISVFPKGTCEGDVDTPGANTCYATNDWKWTDNWVEANQERIDTGGAGTAAAGVAAAADDADDDADNDDGMEAGVAVRKPALRAREGLGRGQKFVLRDEHGSKAFTLTAPGDYEFRVMYCGCGECNYVIGEFSECSSYSTYGVSETVTVPPPIDPAVYAKMSGMSKFVAGLIWKALADKTSPEDAAQLVEKMFAPPSTAETGDAEGCITDAEQTLQSFEAVAQSFVALYDDFSMDNLITTMEDMATATASLAPVCAACGIEEKLPSFFEDLEEAAEVVATKLSNVAKLVKMAVEGVEVYTEVSNIFLTMRQGNYWGAGVFAKELFSTVAMEVAMETAAPVAVPPSQKSTPKNRESGDQ